MHSHTFKIALTAVLGLLIAGCGTSGSDGGGSGNGTTYVGQITSVGGGSITVNGNTFSTTNSSISIDEDSGTEDGLSNGMVVSLSSHDGSSAEDIEYDEEVEGPIADDPVLAGTEKSFPVLGIGIIVDSTLTVFDDSDITFTFDTMVVNDVVEVSGHYDGAGVLHATYIKKTGVFDALNPGATHVELKGTISGLTVAGDEFNLDTVLVKVLAETEIDIAGGLADGLLVEVEGVLEDASTILAEEIEDEDELEDHEGNHVELQGMVSGFTDISTNFMVGTIEVNASGAVIEDGLVIADGIMVEVEGQIVEGVLVATEVGDVSPDDGMM